MTAPQTATPARWRPREGQDLDTLWHHTTPIMPGASSNPARRLESCRDFLAGAPGPKSGKGNPWLIEAAWACVKADIPADQALADIQAAMPHKPVAEVARAVRAAYRLRNDWTFNPIPRIPAPKVDTGRLWADTLMKYPAEDARATLFDLSPTRLLNDPAGDAVLTLESLYRPNDLLYMGKQYHDGIPGVNIRTASEWIDAFNAGLPVPEQIQVNPVTGKTVRLDNGKLSYRCDATVARFPYAVVEFDTRPIEHQAAFLLYAIDHRWPVACAVFSGSKSLHAWIRIDAESAEEWSADVEQRLFGFLKIIGADGNTKNESRQSRTPGAIRQDTGNRQALLYLKGGDV